MTPPIHEKGFAKLNLYLHVGPPLPTGRHPLESLVAFADIGDDVSLEPIEGPEHRLTIDGPFAGGLAEDTLGDNLCLRALGAYQRASGWKDARFHIRLTKNLPIAAGLGGGSADAAAVLRAVNAVAPAPLSLDDLAQLARPLGADVPACVYARPVMMEGTGEDVRPAACPPFGVVLANPRAPAPTGAVYRQFDALNLGAEFHRDPDLGSGSMDEVLARLGARRNDLEAPAITIAPTIAEMMRALDELPGRLLARMAGSGASGFALFETAAAAATARTSFAARIPAWWSASGVLIATSSLSRAERAAE